MRGVNDIFVGAELKRQGVLLRHTLSSPSYFTRTNGHRHAVEIEPLSTCAPSDIIFYRHKTPAAKYEPSGSFQALCNICVTDSGAKFHSQGA
jgi:hypothetical protein